MNNSFVRPVRVLLVEDHQLKLWGLCTLINGHRPLMQVVGVACSQADALARLHTTTPDLVLMKYELASMGSEGTLHELLAGECRTLLMLDNACPENLARAVLCGAHGVLTKTSSAEEVIKAIEKTYAGELWFGRETTTLALSQMRSASIREVATRDTIRDCLTLREREVLNAVIHSCSRPNKSVAKQLFITESTLRNHLSSIYQKLGVSNRLDLYMYAQNCGYAPETKHPM